MAGIGASAGGLEAFTQLLEHLPSNTGMAFVLVQHLDPTHESQLTDLLSRVTRLPIAEVTEGIAVRADHIYVIPPNTNMTIAAGLLKLSPRGEARSQHLPLDVFFRSLAKDRQSRAIGVVLSGTGSDGSLGLAEIKAAGGITFAQDEKSARHPIMPLNAINGGCVDFVLPPDEIARELARIGRHPYLSLRPAAGGESDADDSFQRILARLRSATGIDFRYYRDTTIRRRIARRMAIHRRDSLADYLQLLDQDTHEVEALYGDILINVTSFFRDPEAFEALKSLVFPEILKDKSPEMPIRLWVPGCSAGQEAYSLAIALLEFLDENSLRPPIQIFGTDINDPVSVERARVGLYPHGIESEVSPERLRRFFAREDGGYRIGKSIRDMCIFARQNVAADPPFSRLDMISCRNVLIYLSGPLQNKVIPTFHYALNPGGFLLLGVSESVGRFTDLFGLVDKKHNIYSKTASLTRRYPDFAAGDYRARAPSVEGSSQERPVHVADMQKEADRVVLGRYAPAGVLVDEDLEILQFRGRTCPYLEPPQGEASFNLLRMARDNLYLELRSAIEEAKGQNATASRQGVLVRDEHQTRNVNLEVIPIRLPGSSQRCLLVLFEEAGKPAVDRTAAGGAAGPQGAEAAPPDRIEVEQLRRELTAAKEYLQAVIEQQSAANEELKSANEEILSSNEELQSTNEELQTAKEELQSTNEELRTVNDELQSRNQEVTQINDDLTNTLGSVRIPMVMLGRDLRIRRFTPVGGALLNLLPTDLGRPLSDIRPAFDVPDLEPMLLGVIDTVAPQEREVRDRDGRWYLLRVHPYRTADDRIDGAVLVLLDIDERRRGQEASDRLAAIVESSSDAIIGETLDGTITSWNVAAERIFGHAAREAIGKPISILASPDRPAEMMEILERLRAGEGVEHFETVRICKGGRRIDVSLTASPIRDKAGRVMGASSIFRDITDRKRLERERESIAQLADLVRNAREVPDMMRAVARFLQERSGCDAVGIRFVEGDDFPYCEARGFSAEFLDAENHLCVAAPEGGVLYDAEGKSVLACVCGVVLRGRFEPSKPYFTPYGSFWTNGARELVAGEPELRSQIRGRCIQEGYESVGLFPLRSGDHCLGLIQLNDRRKGFFTADAVAMWERVAGSLAMALVQFRTEEELRQTHHRLTETLNSITDAFFSVDPDFVVTDMNPAAERVLGKTTGELLGRNLWEQFPEAVGSRFQREYVQALAEGKAVHFEEYYPPLGVWFDVDVYPSSVGLAIYFRDVSDRKRAEEALRESEERFRTLAANAQDIIFRYEYLPCRRYAYISPAVTAITGYTLEEFHADPDILLRLVHPDDRAMFEPMARGEAPTPPVFSVRFVHKDGRTIWTEQRCRARRDEAGRLVAVEGITRDITERKLAEVELREAKEAAEVADRAKDRFLAVLSHELRTPLTPVLATSSLLLEDRRLDADTRQALEVIHRNAELEARLIDDLLDVTRIARGKVELDRRPVALSTILDRAVEVCRPDIEGRRLEFGVDVKDAPHWVHADAGRMQQVFWNLLKNAIKFTPQGGCVGIRCWREDDQVMTQVNDSGMGIEPEVLPRLFKPFEQGSPETTREFGGLGLGLTICKTMVEMHGGTIEAMSKGKGQGATFTVRLPVCAPPSSVGEGSPATGAARSPAARRLRILLAEDHGDSAWILRRILTASGHEVQTAGDMAAALRLAAEQRFDLLISDLGLPDGSGHDLIRELRGRGQSFPAIALSGYGYEQDIAQSLAAGFSAHLTKPTSLQQIDETIAAVVR